jgi:polyisoprenoid-binding protein YceI
MLSFLGHSPTFAVRDFAGDVGWDTATSGMARLQLVAKADSLDLVDNVRSTDREEIVGRMRREVLDTTAYPEIRFEAVEVAASRTAPNQYRLRISGPLSLHGTVHRETVEADLLVCDDGVRLKGEFPLRLSDYRIRPVTALGGAIRLQDQLRLSFDIVAWRSGQ